jgi:hypothetical protein
MFNRKKGVARSDTTWPLAAGAGADGATGCLEELVELRTGDAAMTSAVFERPTVEYRKGMVRF